jgi:two-component system phosphate regulon sensor histidine kinase PhoR
VRRAQPSATQLPQLRTSTLGVYFLVAIPAALVLTCAILILVYQQSGFDVAMGVLLVTFCAAIGAGAARTILGLRQDRRLAALQLDFVSKVSHELKTPLTSIRMFVDTLRMGRVQDPEKISQCLDVISKETDRLSQLIGRLLSWGAMEAGAFTVELGPQDPAGLLRAMLRLFEPHAIAAGVEVVTDIAEDLPAVRADEAALGDSLLNLLSNAVRYGGADKKVFVRLHQSGPWICFSVRDNGIGIEDKHQSRIFERFYRADERYSRATGGTGLGLAIARHIVLAHGGQIDVESKPGEGSIFTIRLPVAEEDRGEAEETHE